MRASGARCRAAALPPPAERDYIPLQREVITHTHTHTHTQIRGSRLKSRAEVAAFAGRQLANPAPRAPPAAAASPLVEVRTPGVLPLPAVVVEVLYGLDVAGTH
jgi:hypothetical protein